MPIIRLITDANAAKDKLLVSADLKKPIQTVTKNITDKTKIKTPDLWTVAAPAKAEKEKDPQMIVLGTKLDPKLSFDKQGIADKGFVYVKKKGAPPNDPEAKKAAKKAASPKAAPASPTESVPPPPTPSPAVPPPPPPEAPPAKVAPPPPPAAKEAPPPPPAPTPPAPPAAPAAAEAAPTPPAPPAAPQDAAATAPPAPPAPKAETLAPPPPPVATPPPPPAAAGAAPPPTPTPPAAPAAAAAAAPAPAAPPVAPPSTQPPSQQQQQSGGAGGPPPPSPSPSSPSAAAAAGAKRGSAVEAFIEELAGLGKPPPAAGSTGADHEGEVLGALMAELSAKSPGEREALRSLGQRRSRSPMGRWAEDHRGDRPAAARGMLEVAGLIEQVTSGSAAGATSHGGRRSAGGGSSAAAARAFGAVADFLQRIGLEKYEAVFAEADFDYQTLLDATESDLVEIGVAALGARRRILSEAARVKATDPVAQQHQPHQHHHHPRHYNDEVIDDDGGNEGPYHPHHPHAQPRSHQHHHQHHHNRRRLQPPQQQQQHGGPYYQEPDSAAAFEVPQQQPYPPAAAYGGVGGRGDEEVDRLLRRDKELEKRWEEVCIMHAAGGPDAGEWDRRWDAARRQDTQEAARWHHGGGPGRTSPFPPAARTGILTQRLHEIQSASAAAAAAPAPPVSPRGGGGVRGGVPHPWQVYYTEQGAAYYYNKTTGVTQWTAPRGSPSPPPGGRLSPRHLRAAPVRAHQPAAHGYGYQHYPHYN